MPFNEILASRTSELWYSVQRSDISCDVEIMVCEGSLKGRVVEGQVLETPNICAISVVTILCIIVSIVKTCRLRHLAVEDSCLHRRMDCIEGAR